MCAFSAVPLMLGPIWTDPHAGHGEVSTVQPKKVAPKGVLLINVCKPVKSDRMLTPARTTVFPLPWTSHATPTRGERLLGKELYLELYREGIGSPGPTCSYRWSCSRVHIGIEVAHVIVAFQRRPHIFVAQAQVQGDFGGDAPIILEEAREPVTPKVRRSCYPRE